MHSETRGAFGADLCHGLQFGGNDKGCFGCFLNLLNGEFGVVFGKQQTFGSYEHNAHLGDDLCDAFNCGVGQFAFFKDFGLALCGVFHCNDNVLCADEQIHCAAHAGHFFAGDDPVCKGTLFVNFEAAEDGCINMTAANECERGGTVDEACAGCCCGGAAACINNVERIAVFVRYGAGADGAVLALKDNVNVFGKIWSVLIARTKLRWQMWMTMVRQNYYFLLKELV